MALALSKTARAQLAHLLNTYEGEHRATALRATIRGAGNRLAKAMSVGYKEEKAELKRRMTAKAKAAPTVKPTAKPMTGDDMLASAEKLLHAGRIDPATAQRIVTSVHLGRLPEAADLMKSACQ